MRLIISPAKKMKVDTDSFPCHRLPAFLPQTQEILARLQTMSGQELKSLWKCSDKIALLNQQRLACMDLHRMLTPAILAYEGIQYQYMAPGVFNQEELAYVEEHLRILSGFYGLLRPFDGVTPYRLEMQAKLAVSGAKDLYAYWGGYLGQGPFSGDAGDCQPGIKGVQSLYRGILAPGSHDDYLHFRGGEGWNRGGEGNPLQNGARRDGSLSGPGPRENAGANEGI